MHRKSSEVWWKKLQAGTLVQTDSLWGVFQNMRADMKWGSNFRGWLVNLPQKWHVKIKKYTLKHRQGKWLKKLYAGII